MIFYSPTKANDTPSQFFFQKLFSYFAATSKLLFVNRFHIMPKETISQIFGGQKMYAHRQQTRDSCDLGWVRESIGKVSRDTLTSE